MIEKLQMKFDVAELLALEQQKAPYISSLDKLSYLKDLSEIDIQKCYQNCFLKDIFYRFDDFPEQNFRMLVNLKFTAISNFLR